MDLLKDLLIMYRYLNSTTVLARWKVASIKPDLTPDEFPSSPLNFLEHVDRLYVRLGKSMNWVSMRFRCNKLLNFFTSDYNSLGKAWFDAHNASGYPKVCQTDHDTDVVGWFLMTGPFTNYIFLKNSIQAAMAKYLPTGARIEFRCYPVFQKVCKPLESDTEDPPGHR